LNLLFHTLFLGSHLLAVDLAMAGPLVAIWLEGRETRLGDALAGRIGRRLAAWSLAAATIGIGLGLVAVVALAQLESSAYRETFSRVQSYRWWGVAWELAFYVVCIAAYVLLWERLRRHRWWHRGLAVLATTNLIWHFPALFTIISTLTMRPDLKDLPLDRALYWKLLLDGETMSRVVHHWLAAAAVAAGAAMLLGAGNWGLGAGKEMDAGLGARGEGRAVREEKRGAPADAKENAGAQIVRGAARLALVATLFQIPVGLWVLFALPTAVQNQLLGEDWIATSLFGLSVVAALGLMHHLAMASVGTASLGKLSQRAVFRTAMLLAAVVFLMVATLHRARQCVLEPTKSAIVASDLNSSSLSLWERAGVRGIAVNAKFIS
jgi:hypothetical protein